MKLGPLSHNARRILACMLVMTLVVSCARQHRVTSDLGSDYNSQEARVGLEIHQRILKTFPVFPDVRLQAYVRSVGQRLANVADRQELRYEFVVLKDDRVYAMHAPGGYVYVTSGFLRFLQSEIELAGVLAHEIGALQYKDPRFSIAKKAFEHLMVAGSQIGPAFGGIGALALLGLSVIGIFVTHEPSFEKQLFSADAHALQYLVASGFDPQGLIDPLRRMEDPNSGFRAYVYDYLESHPLTLARQEKLSDEFEALELSDQDFRSGRETYLSMTESITSFA